MFLFRRFAAGYSKLAAVAIFLAPWKGAPALATPQAERFSQWIEKPAEVRLLAGPDGVMLASAVRSVKEVRIEARLYPRQPPFGEGILVLKQSVSDPSAQGLQLGTSSAHRWFLAWRETTSGGSILKVETLWPGKGRLWNCKESIVSDPNMAATALPERSAAMATAAWASTTDTSCSLKLQDLGKPPETVRTVWEIPREGEQPCGLFPKIVSDLKKGWMIGSSVFSQGRFELRVRYEDAQGQSVWEQNILEAHPAGEPELKTDVWTDTHELRMVWVESTGAGMAWKAQSLDAAGQQLLPEGGVLLHESSMEADYAQSAMDAKGSVMMAWQDSALEGTKVHLRRWPAQGLSGPPDEQDFVLGTAELAELVSVSSGQWVLFWLLPGEHGWELWGTPLALRPGTPPR